MKPRATVNMARQTIIHRCPEGSKEGLTGQVFDGKVFEWQFGGRVLVMPAPLRFCPWCGGELPQVFP